MIIRKYLALIMAFTLLLPFILSPTDKSGSQIASTETISTADDTEKNVETYESLCVDMSVNGDGYYALMSDVEIHYGEDSIDYLYINDPTLLAFHVSSEYNGGIWVLDLEQGEQLLNELTEVKQSLNETGNSGLSEQIENAISILEGSGPITQAST